MPDYDLGKARGEVEIKVNKKGFRDASNAVEDLTDETARLGKQFDDSTEKLQKFEKEVDSSADAVDDLTDSEKKLAVARGEAEKKLEARRKAEAEYKASVADTTATEEDNAKALAKRNKAMGEHMQAAKAAKKAERELIAEIEGVTQALNLIPDKKKTKIELDTREAESKIRRFNDKMQGLRNAGKITSKLMGPEKAALKGGAMASGGGALAGMAGLAGSGLTGMSVNGIIGIVDALGQMSGVLGTLPGLLATAGAAMGTLKIATVGFGDAMSAILDGDSEAFAKALEKLSGNAQQLFIAFNTVAPAIEAFRFAVQDAFTKDLAGLVRPLAEQYLPMLQKNFVGFANILNGTVRDLAAWAQQTYVFEDLQHIFGNITKAMGTLAPTARMLADAFLDILSVSSDFAPELAATIQIMVKDFRDWIQTLRDNGGLADWMRTGIDAFKQGIEIVKQFGGAFARIFQIGQETGGGLLPFLEKVGTMFNNWVNSAEGSNALTQFFTSITQATDALLPVLASLGTTLFGTIIPMFADLGTATAPGILSFFQSFGDAMRILAPIIVSLAPALNQMLVTLGHALVDIIKTIGPELPAIFQSLADAFSALAPHLPAIAEGFLQIFTGVKDGKTEFKGLLDYLPGIMDTLGRLIPIALKVYGAFQNLKAGLLAAGVEILSWITDIGSAIGTFLGKLMTEWPAQAGSYLHDMFSRVWGAIAEGVPGGLEVVKNKLTEFFSGLPDTISGFLSELTTRAYEAGKHLIEDMMRGIKERLGSLGAVAKSIVETITDWLPGSPAKKGPLSGKGWSYVRGQSLSSDLAAGMSSGQSDAASAAANLAAGVSGELGTGALGSAGMPEGRSFTGDMMQIVDVASRISDLFKSVFDQVLNFAKIFTTNPLTGESIFGKRWEKTVKDDDVRKAREDKAFQDAYNNAKKTDADAAKRAGPAGSELATMAPIPKDNASKDEIASAIIAEGQRQGLSQEAILAAIGVAIQETGLGSNPRTNDVQNQNGTPGITGVFQQDMSYRKYGDPRDPNNAVKGFISEFVARGGLDAANPWGFAVTDVQKPAKLGAGGYDDGTGDYIKEQHRQAALDYYNRLSTGANATGGKVAPPLSSGSGKYGLPQGTDTGGYGNAKAGDFPPWVFALAKQFNLSPSTYGSHQESDRNEPGYAPNPNHENRGIDWSGSVEDMQAFADALAKAAPNMPGLEQIIWENPNTGKRVGLGGAGNPTTGYYPDTGEGSYEEHRNHVHTRQSTPITINADGATIDMADSWFKKPPIDPRQQAAADAAAIAALPDPAGFGNSIGQAQKPDYVTGPGIPDNMAVGADGRLFYDDQAAKDEKSLTLDEAMLQELRSQNGSLDAALALYEAGNTNDAQVGSILGQIDTNIASLQGTDTPQARAQIEALQGIQGKIASESGFSQVENDPLGTASTMASGGFALVSDIFGAINSGLTAIDNASALSDTLVRGVENTGDVSKIIDNVQSFVDFAASISQAVSSGLGLASTIAGAAAAGDPSGGASGAAAALGAASSIAGGITAALQTVNAVIDIGQEVVSIAGKYVGDFLSSVLGAGQGNLYGDLKMLLDLNTNQLISWSNDNPEDKRSINAPWFQDRGDINQTRERTPDLNLYIGPGTDPNDAMNAAMWELKTGGQGAFADSDF